jgi:Putative sterol carrier protein
MAAEIFTEEWANAWCEKINENASYRKAAERWEGAIVLVMTADPDFGIPEERAVIADLWHGECRSGHTADAAARDAAPYVISGSPAAWRKILDGEADPIVALMGGKLKLARGGLFSLLPYAKAAKEMVVSATQVDTSFPPGWR